MIETKEALDYMKREFAITRTRTTLINWCKPFKRNGLGIGEKIAGRWRVDKTKLKIVLQGKQWKLKEQEEKRKEKEAEEKRPVGRPALSRKKRRS